MGPEAQLAGQVQLKKMQDHHVITTAVIKVLESGGDQAEDDGLRV